jgi:hypothetical protein
MPALGFFVAGGLVVAALFLCWIVLTGRWYGGDE